MHAAADAGHLDERRAALESLTAIKRAGAGTIVTYWAKDLARVARERQRDRDSLAPRDAASFPGGVNSPVRAMRAVGMDEPVFVRRGEGAIVEDVDGNRYVDWVQSWGPLIFGHADPETLGGDPRGGRSTARRSARRPRPRSSSPPRSSTPCRRSRWCGS